MPGKFAALRVADERTERAELVGSANTLVRTERGWRADNTDIDGVRGALGAVSGSGDGARLRRHRPRRGRWRWPGSVSSTSRWSPATRTRPPGWWSWPPASGWGRGSARSTTTPWPRTVAERPWWSARCPPTSRPGTPRRSRRPPVLLDAIYDPWPTPLAAAVTAAGGTVISGLQMLLHQAFAQVEQFTGLPAPRAEMAAALD